MGGKEILGCWLSRGGFIVEGEFLLSLNTLLVCLQSLADDNCCSYGRGRWHGGCRAIAACRQLASRLEFDLSA